MLADEVAHLRIHKLAPAPPTENAIVAGTLDFDVALLLGGQAGAQVVCRAGLASAGNVVQFTLNGQQCTLLDVLWAHAFEGALGRAHIPGAIDQVELLEHGFDGFEVVVRIHVQHGVVFVVELAVCLGAAVVALDEVLEVVVVVDGVAIRIHGHKASVLQEAGVDAAASAGEVLRHTVDHVVLEPLEAALAGQVVDGGGRLACVDGAAHHGERQGRGFPPAGHERHRCQHRHRGLAHADHVAIAIGLLQVADEVLHVVHIVVQVKITLGQGHHAGVLPVGDVDLVVAEHGAHGLAQQRCVVARKRRNDQHHGLALEFFQGLGIVGEALESAQFTEGQVDFNALVDGNVHSIDRHGLDTETRLFVVFAQAVDQIVGRSNALGEWSLLQRRQRIAVELGGRQREIGKRLHEGALGFVDLVEHGAISKNVAVQYSSICLRLHAGESLSRGHPCDT